MTTSSDPKGEPAAETSMQRALRLKKAAAEAKGAPPGAKSQPGPEAKMAAGASRPWLKR